MSRLNVGDDSGRAEIACTSAETVNTIVFKEFARGHYAVSAALSTVLFLVMATAGLFLIRTMNRQIDDA